VAHCGCQLDVKPTKAKLAHAVAVLDHCSRNRKYIKDGLARDRRRLTLLIFLSALYAAANP
jgi:hypothetical protein